MPCGYTGAGPTKVSQTWWVKARFSEKACDLRYTLYRRVEIVVQMRIDVDVTPLNVDAINHVPGGLEDGTTSHTKSRQGLCKAYPCTNVSIISFL